MHLATHFGLPSYDLAIVDPPKAQRIRHIADYAKHILQTSFEPDGTPYRGNLGDLAHLRLFALSQLRPTPLGDEAQV